MRQKCVRNASKWVLFYWDKRNVQNASVAQANSAAFLPLDWARGYARTLLVRHCFLAGLAGASLRQAFGLPQWEGACLALSIPLSHTGFVCGGRLRQAFVCPRGTVQQWENGRK